MLQPSNNREYLANSRLKAQAKRVSVFQVAIASILSLSPGALCQSSDVDKSKYKLNASFTVERKDPVTGKFHTVQSFSEKATSLFKDGDFAAAEQYYREALKLAKSTKAPPESVATLTCNLATTLRKQQKHAEAAELFIQAIDLCRANRLKPALCEYIANQYAVLLKQKGKRAEAEFLIVNAKGSFQYRTATFAPVPEKAQSATAKSSDDPLQEQNAAKPAQETRISTGSDAIENSTLDEAAAERIVADYVTQEASKQLQKMKENEPGGEAATWWRVPSTAHVNRTSATSFEASIEVEFGHITNTDSGKIQADMVGVWKYQIQGNPPGNLSVVNCEMPFDVHRSTMRRL